VKARHCGRTVREVILSEFFVCGDDSTNCAAIEKGSITVNNTQTNVGYVLKNGDSIERVVHWHEPPVKVGQRIEVRRVMLTVEGEEVSERASGNGYSHPNPHPHCASLRFALRREKSSAATSRALCPRIRVVHTTATR